MATHTGVHIALVSPFAYWCHADHSGLASVFIILYKKQKEQNTQTSACYTSYRKKKKKLKIPISVLIWKEQSG